MEEGKNNSNNKKGGEQKRNCKKKDYCGIEKLNKLLSEGKRKTQKERKTIERKITHGKKTI